MHCGSWHGELVLRLVDFEESEKRMNNRGSTDDEVRPEQVCQCQGVPPWDDAFVSVLV